MTQLTYQLAVVVLAFYVFSIVYGRLYTGMHSFTDCVFGAALGAGLWGLHILCGQAVDTWSRENGFIGACTPSPHSMLMRPAHPLRGLSARGDRAALPVPGAPAPAAGGRLPVLRGRDRVRVCRDGRVRRALVHGAQRVRRRVLPSRDARRGVGVVGGPRDVVVHRSD